MIITFLLFCKEFCLSSAKPVPDLKKKRKSSSVFKVVQKLKGATTVENKFFLNKVQCNLVLPNEL